MDHNMDSDKEKDESPSERSLESVQETTPPPPAPKKRSLPLRAAKAIANQWFLISLGLVILLTSQVQVPLAHQKLKQTIVSYACVSLIFFLTGCTLKTSILLANYSKWRMHLFVQLQSYLLTSSIIFGLVSACATSRTFMDPGLLLGLIMCGCTPTTIASNVVMTGQAHGNQALTVVESTLGNFLGPFLTPLLFAMYTSSGAWYTAALPTGRGSYGAIYARVFKQLGLSLFLPMILGQLVQNTFPRFTARVIVGKRLSRASPLALLGILWNTYDQAFASGAFQSVRASNVIFILFTSVALFFLFIATSLLTSLPWMSREDAVSVCYVVPAKTPAMGVPLVMTMFVGLTPLLEAKLQIPLVIFQGLQLLGGTVMTGPFSRWIDRGRDKAEAEKDPC